MSKMQLMGRAVRQLLETPRMFRSTCVLLGSLSAAVPATVTAQSAPLRSGFEAGVGVSLGTGSFGGPGLATLVSMLATVGRFQVGAEWIGRFRFQKYSDDGGELQPPPPPRMRTITRWAVNFVGQVPIAEGLFGKAGVGVGAIETIDFSIADAAPLRMFAAPVATLGVGHPKRVGKWVLVPRSDLIFHLGSKSRVTVLLLLSVGRSQ